MNYAKTDRHPYHVYRHAALPFFELLEPSIARSPVDGARRGSGKGWFARAMARLQYAMAVRRTIAELSKLDDHLLYDIGLSRGTIRSAAKQSVDKANAYRLAA